MFLTIACLFAFAIYGYAAYKHGRGVERDLWLRRRDDIIAQWGTWPKPRFRKPTHEEATRLDVIVSKE